MKKLSYIILFICYTLPAMNPLDVIIRSLNTLQSDLTVLQQHLKNVSTRHDLAKKHAEEIDSLYTQFVADPQNLDGYSPETLQNYIPIIENYQRTMQSPDAYNGLLTAIQNNIRQRSGPTIHTIQQFPSLCPLKRSSPTGQPIAIPCFNATMNMYQLSVANQFEMAMQLSIEPAICGVVSLYNAKHLNEYIKTGKQETLEKLNNTEQAKQFIMMMKTQFNIQQWPDEEQMQEIIKQLQTHGPIDVIENLLLYEIGFYGSIFEQIKKGLEQPEYYHTLIIGTGDVAQFTAGRGHWYTFTVVKKNNATQFIILDSAPAAYHLGLPAQGLENDPNNQVNYMRDRYLIDIINQTQLSNYSTNAIKRLIQQ